MAWHVPPYFHRSCAGARGVFRSWGWVAWCLLVAFSTARGEDKSVAEWGAGRDPATIVATVDDAPIRLGEVLRQLQAVLGERPIASAAWPELQSGMLRQLIDRRLILAYLAERPELGASDAELELHIRRIEEELARQQVTLGEHLSALKMSTEEFRYRLAWQIGWQRYLDRFLTPENLRRYFERRPRDFDGTELRVAHLLLKVEAGADAARWQAQRLRAEEIRTAVARGEYSFSEAAERFSEAPSARGGGDLGLLGRRGTMPEEFHHAAFALDAGETSPPVDTPFGVHLIHCLEVRPGRRTWEDAREELREAVTAYLFNWVAEQQRGRARIDYTGVIPPSASPVAGSAAAVGP